MDDRAAIEKIIFENYFDGVGTADANRLRPAFILNASVMIGLRRNGQGGHTLHVNKEINDTIDRWASNPEPDGTDRDGEILELSIVDGQIATAIFRYEDSFYDAFSLLKVEGKWKIISKTFYQR